MASACVNNAVPAPNSAFPGFTTACSTCGWLSPRISLSREDVDPAAIVSSAAAVSGSPDFEFHVEEPVAILPADELISDGKLVPLRISADRQRVELNDVILSPKAERPRRVDDVGTELCAQSPKEPRCSSRWRELLGLKKQQSPKPDLQNQKTASSPSKTPNVSTRSLRHLLHRCPKPSAEDSSLGIPLLSDIDSEPVSISARRSLSSSSSSSGADHDEFPRLSLDAENRALGRISFSRPPPGVRLFRSTGGTAENHQMARTGRSPATQRSEAAPPPGGVSVDSPRMNASGKVVFQGLERSSSSPGSFRGASAGGQHYHHRRAKPYGSMERSYSANVRVAPVLNVVSIGSLRVCSSKPAFGFGQLFAHKKVKDASAPRLNPHGSGIRSKVIDKNSLKTVT